MQATNPTEHILLADGSRVLLDEILLGTSFDLYQTAEHYDICLRAARSESSDPMVQKVLANLFALKSTTARKATALAAFFRRAEPRIEAISVAPGVRAMLPDCVVEGVRFETWRGPDESHIAWNHVVLLLCKAVLHRLFRLYPGAPERGATLLRTWVEVSASLYPDALLTGEVLIYPFALNVRRQWRFYRWCRQKKLNMRLAGLPYRPLQILSDIVSRRPNHMILARAEVSANASHALELLEHVPREVLTSDEFETGSLALHQVLLAAGVEVINTAHGVGNYCPFVAYSRFRVLSRSQSTFYAQRNPAIAFDLIPNDSHKLDGLPPYSASSGKPLAVVLVHQSFELTQLVAEGRAQKRIDVLLAQLAAQLGFKYLIKMHPNSRRPKGDGKFGAFAGEPIYDWSSLASFRPVFVTINSTVFLDVRGIAPALAYAGPTFDPRLYFPSPVMTFTSENIESILRHLSDNGNWLSAAAFHADGSGAPPLGALSSEDPA